MKTNGSQSSHIQVDRQTIETALDDEVPAGTTVTRSVLNECCKDILNKSTDDCHLQFFQKEKGAFFSQPLGSFCHLLYIR